MNTITRLLAPLKLWTFAGRDVHMSTHHKVFLMRRYLEYIETGIKTVEGRVATPRFNSIHPGDNIQFIASDDKKTFLLCKVLRVGRYESFRQMLEKEGVENCLPGIKTIEKGVEIYHQFPNFKTNALKHGVCAFKIEKVKDSL